MTVSVIIPYHNEDIEIFKKCLYSVLNQTYDDYEVIIVDDGSDEKNSKELDNLICNERKIKLLKQENQGVSQARNNGVKEASGKYVTFVDADDIVVPYFLEEAMEIIISRSADILYSFVKRTADENIKIERNKAVSIVEVDDEWIREKTIGNAYIKDGMFFGRGPWARVLKKEIAMENPFPIGIPIGEDVLWNLSLLKGNYKKVLAECTWYKYMIREGAVTNRYDPNIVEKLMLFYNILYKSGYKRDIKDRHLYERVFRDLKRYVFAQYLGNPNNKDMYLVRQRKFYQICKKDPWKIVGQNNTLIDLKWKEKIKWLLYKSRLLFLAWTLSNKMHE